VKTEEAGSQTSARRIFRNFGFLIIGKTVGDVFNFLFFTTLSRTYGQEGIGQYAFAMALASSLAVFADFGLYRRTVKEISRLTGSLGEYYRGIFFLRLLLSSAIFLLLLLTLSFLPLTWEIRLIILIIAAHQVMYSLIDGFTAVCVGREDMHLAGMLDAAFKATTALMGTIVVLAGGSLVISLAALPTMTFGQLLVVCQIVRRKYGRFGLAARSWSYITHTLYESLPYALSELLVQLSSRVDIVILTLILGVSASGIYHVAYRVVFIFLLIPNFIGIAMSPMLSKLYVNSREELIPLYQKSLNLIILIGLPAAAGLWLIAPGLIQLIFGKTFAESASILRILAWLLPLGFFRSILEIFLISCDRQVERARSQWWAAWVSFLCNMFFILVVGVKGAAIATVLSGTFLVVLFAIRMRPVLGWPRIGSRLGMSLVASISFTLPLMLFPSLSMDVMVPIAILLYSGALLLFKEIRRNEVPMLLSIFKRGLGRQIPTRLGIP
jgi:O-antigen/teichoic acid export membrane protein